jgi:signal transduction histidine kinase
MSAEDGRLDRDSCARGFARAAQHFANMLSGADVLAESREIIRSVFGPDLVYFCSREEWAGKPRAGPRGPPGERAGDGAASPPSAEGAGPGRGAIPVLRGDVLRRAVRHVVDTGLMAMESVGGELPAAYVLLPVSVRGLTEWALLVGYAGERELRPHVLEALLGVAALAGATLARQRAERELLALAEERVARTVAQVTERRARLLSEVSKALFASFDDEAALGAVARLLVPELADWCAVELRDGERPDVGRSVAVVHADPEKVELVREIRARPAPDMPRGAARVMATGEPQLHTEITDSLLSAWARKPRHLRAAKGAGVGSAMIVPLGVRGTVHGAITLVASGSRRFGREDLALAEEIGRRAGTAMENARLYREAQEAIEVRDQFLAVASHELKTPLTALMLVIEGAERALDRIPNAPAAMRSKIASLSRQGQRLTHLVTDLLDVARIQSGHLGISIEDVDLSAVTQEVVERHRQGASAAGCALALVADYPVTGAWDRSRVDQVVSNLLSNAIKYGAGKPVSLYVESSGETARLCVADRGIGIAREDHERIFRRFERAVEGSGFAGMGLGLWITQEIVTRLGGSIRVESRRGAGARFVVELPLRPPDVTPSS